MSKPKATIGRRQLLRAGMTGLFATAASALEPGTVAADTPTAKNASLAFRQTLPRFKPSTESTATRSPDDVEEPPC
jgi:hypothetical protein